MISPKNIIEFEVMSRKKAKDFSFQENIEDCIIISITDVNSNDNCFANNLHIKGILRLKFDDCETNEPNCITKEDAIKIIKFVNNHISNIRKIIVHCEAGVSRSAGVCAALMLIITGSDSQIFDNPRYCPNMSCYRAVMEAYYGSYDQKAANKKIRHNIEIWRAEQGLD